MNDTLIKIILIYFVAVSVAASAAACIDKYKAKKNKWRIPESTLMLLGFLGGALAEYVTMKIIRHKTLHKKFMLGLPLFILLHIALIAACVFFLT